MNPIHFGSAERALFGLYHPALGFPARPRGVVLCNPFGDEAIKAHRAFRQLAQTLVKERFHVLRFDYFGTGDSLGDGAETSFEQWLSDVGTAIDEIKDTAAISKVSLVGLRLGASLALLAALGRRDVDAVVLWDPVLDGSAYLASIARAHAAYLESELYPRRLSPERLYPPDGDHALGFELPEALRGPVASLNLSEAKSGSVGQVALVVTSAVSNLSALTGWLRDGGSRVTQERVPVGPNWNSDEAMNASLVPTEALGAIVRALTA